MHARKMSDSPVVCTQSEWHGSLSRSPSVVCSGVSPTNGAQRCPDDKPHDILPACCKNWVIGIDSADSAVVGEGRGRTPAATRRAKLPIADARATGPTRPPSPKHAADKTRPECRAKSG